MSKISNSSYVLAFMSLFVISTAILLIASTATTPLPAWGGYVDVGLAVLIALTGIAIYQRSRNQARHDIAHRAAVVLVSLSLVGMWVLRDVLDFKILLPGLVWRLYFFLSILPHAIHLWTSEPA